MDIFWLQKKNDLIQTNSIYNNWWCDLHTKDTAINIDMPNY